MRLQPGEVGQLVDAFLADHGGIHVGEKQLLAPVGPRLHDDVDRRSPRASRRRFCDGLVVRRCRRKGNVGGDLVEQPVRRAGARAARRARRRRRVLSSAGSAGLEMRVAT